MQPEPDVIETTPLPENAAKVQQARKNGHATSEMRIPFGAPSPIHPPVAEPAVNGNEVLRSVYDFVRRFVGLSEEQGVVVALWAAHTHCFSAASITPYLSITSAEKQSGKSTLLEVLGLLVANPWTTAGATAAAMVRKIDRDKPTLLLDEVDAAFNGDKEKSEALRGILNAGYAQGGVFSKCVGKGTEMDIKDFSAFCPKAIAGIGKLPDTVADRSIPIRLKRKARQEQLERFRIRKKSPEGHAIRHQLETWCQSIVESLYDADPPLPDELSDRQQDGAEPLLAIAGAAGKGWPQIARAAIVALCAKGCNPDDSIGIRLLVDIRKIFLDDEVPEDRIASGDLIDKLVLNESSPWAEYIQGKPLSKTKLAHLLKRYDIANQTVRDGHRIFRGYLRADFEDAWARYLPPMPVGEVQK